MLVEVAQCPVSRARQEIDDGRRGAGDVVGPFQPTTAAALTWTAARRTTATVVAFLELGEAGIDPALQRVSAILDHLYAHRATAVLLFALAHPRCEFVFPPTYAADLNLIEPWW